MRITDKKIRWQGKHGILHGRFRYSQRRNGVLRVAFNRYLLSLMVLLGAFISWNSLIPDLLLAAFSEDFRGFLDVVAESSPHATTNEGEPCKYHANCPTGSVCAATVGGGGGTCEPYWNDKVPQQQPHDDSNANAHGQQCVDLCLKELEVEENAQFASIPLVQSTYVAAQPHHGCVIDFQRVRRTEPWKEQPTEQYYLAQRFRSVVRIDPLQNGTTPIAWRAFCHAPCIADSDCPSHYQCQNRTMERPSQHSLSFPNRCQPKLPPYDHDMVIVTGANDAYFAGLRNFASSLRYWAPTKRLVVYNLGMDEAQKLQVETWPNVLTLKWKHGFPAAFPPHISENLKNYAWKSLAINESAHEHNSIFWFDAGGTIVGPLDAIEEIVELHGVFLVKGQDLDMKSWTLPDTYQYFGYDKDNFQGGPSYAGNTQAYAYPSRYIDLIVKPNAECALTTKCISPPGSSLSRHRYDQSSLSVLAYQPHIQAPHYTEFLADDFTQLRNGHGVETYPFILWTSRQRCDHYAVNAEFHH